MSLVYPSRHRAFSLIELLVVIGIIAILLGILLPTISRVRESANTIKCAANSARSGRRSSITHVAAFKKFDPQALTFHPTEMKDWDQVERAN